MWLAARIRVVPGEGLKLAGCRGILPLIELLEAASQIVNEPGLRAGGAGRVNGLVMPLHQPLGVGVGAILLGCDRCRKQKDLRLDVRGPHLSASDFGSVVPERCGLRLEQVTDHQPVEVGERPAGEVGVLTADRRVLPHAKESLHGAFLHHQEHRLEGVVPADLGQQVVGEVVLRLGHVAVVGLEEAHHIGGGMVPPAGRRRHLAEIVRQGGRRLGRVGHRQVTGQQVVESWNVGTALDRGVTAKGHDPTARPSNITKQELEQGAAGDHLGPGGVLSPRHGVGKSRRPFRARVAGDGVRHLEEELSRHAAGLLDQLRGVPREVALHDLEDAVWVLQGRIDLQRPIGAANSLVVRLRVLVGILGRRRVGRLTGVAPGIELIAPLGGDIPGEEARQVLGVAEVLANDGRCVGVVADVLVEPEPVRQDVVNERSEKSDVRPRAQGHMKIREGGRAGESGVNVNDRRPALPGLNHEPEPDRVVLRHIGAHDHDAVAVREVLKEGSRAAASQSGAQTGHRGGVSYAGLILHRRDTEAGGEELLDEVILFVVQGRAAQVPDRQCPIDEVALLVTLLKGRVPRRLHPPRDALHGPA